MSDTIEYEDIEVGKHVVIHNYDGYGITKGKEYPVGINYQNYDEIGIIDDYGNPTSVDVSNDYSRGDHEVTVKEVNQELNELKERFIALVEDANTEIGAINVKLKDGGVDLRFDFGNEPSVDWHSSSMHC